MSLTVKELLLNHSRTDEVKHYDGQYFDSEIMRFDDIVDAQEHQQALKADYDILTEEIKIEEQNIKEAAKAAKKAHNDAIRAAAAAIEPTDPPEPTA